MKILISFLSVLLFLGSCVPENSVKHYNEHIVISGKIENTSASSFQLFEQVSSIDWKAIKTIELDENREFKYAFQDSLASYYRMTNEDFDLNVYLTPKDSVYVIFDAKDPLLTIKVKGERGKHENRYLLAKKFFINKYFTDSLYQLPEDDFHKEIMFIRKEFLYALNEANIKQGEFRKRERIALDYLIAKLLLNYPYVNAMIKEGQVELSTDYFAFKSSVLSEFDGCMVIPEYVDFYTNLILYDLKVKNDFSKEAFSKAIQSYFNENENIEEMKRVLF